MNPLDLAGAVAGLGIRKTIAWRNPQLATVQPTPAPRTLQLRNGSTVVTTAPPPTPDAPTVVLLHGLACTGALCWASTFHELSKVAGIVTFDQRWHGRGIDSPTFTLEDCADDVADVLDALGIDRAIVVGYSLGGAIAQLVWRRHPERVSGLILCSTARNARGAWTERIFLQLYGIATGRMTSLSAQRVSAKRAAVRADDDQHGGLAPDPDEALAWVRAQTRLTTLWALPQAAHAFTAFNSAPWVSGIDVPTAVVITDLDHAIPTRRQVALANAIPNASTHHVAAGHAAIILDATTWVPVFLEAVHDVATRAAREGVA